MSGLFCRSVVTAVSVSVVVLVFLIFALAVSKSMAPGRSTCEEPFMFAPLRVILRGGGGVGAELAAGGVLSGGGGVSTLADAESEFTATCACPSAWHAVAADPAKPSPTMASNGRKLFAILMKASSNFPPRPLERGRWHATVLGRNSRCFSSCARALVPFGCAD